jgi:HK97 family phage portal protein
VRLFRRRRETRSEFGSSVIPPPYGGFISHAGQVVTIDSAGGLPAVSSAIIRLAELIASLPLIVYTGEGGERRRARESWQWRLLHDSPNLDCSPFDFVFDVVACVESHGNAYVQKIKARGRVEELRVLDPALVVCRRDRTTGEKLFEVQATTGRLTLSTAEILHVRGPTLKGGHVGLSPVQLHRNAIGNALAREEFSGRFIANDARPGVALKFPQTVNTEQAKSWAEAWNESHAGPRNARKTGVLGGGADIQLFPVSLEDAQFVETMRYGIAEVARMFRIPRSLLEEGELGQTSNEVERVAKFSLLPRFRRIERAFAADPDLFAGSDLFPEFLADGLLRPDTVTKYRGYKDARQGGWVTANEVRGWENLPPLDGGDELQVTPVGGAPNEEPAPPDPGSRSVNGDRAAIPVG